ncbi:MAG: polyribonucleotide nucleotidyltransferase [Clostridia bacterium]|nr:polyribonucleotide nucleotidyltransferase [Clostridia bacterium]
MEGNRFSMNLDGKEIVVTMGKYAEFANGSCIVSCGESSVMVNTTMSKAPRAGMDFFPLGVDFEEKMYSVGKIPGGFKKREGRGSDKAILISRLIDRPIRPLFPKGFYNDVTVVATPLSVDNEFPTEVLAMIGSSIALTTSDIPFGGPTGSVVVGMIDGKFILNPSASVLENSDLPLTVSGTKDAIMMVEAGANEISEATMLDAIMFAHEYIKKEIEFIEEIQKQVGKEKAVIEYYKVPEEIENAIREYATDKLKEALAPTTDKEERHNAVDEVEADVHEHFAEIFPESAREINDTLYKMKKEIVRDMIFNKGIRPDGRKLTDIRPIWCEVGMLPRVHGSSVFTRGQTQVMNALTLGSIGDVQKLEGLDPEEEKRYMHQYNMPPYSTGEARPLKAPGRREIGHGALAERALEPVIPSEEDFPYTIRLVSEVLSSNGSSSMASTCASTLSLMDAGVPIKAPVAGVAMGLIKQDDQVAVLTDIQGIEDFYGDMDFKVTGTEKGITAIQMDIKIKGIDKAILTKALEQARIGRLEIMQKMLATIDKPRENLSKYAPKITAFNIDPEKIREVIGSGGKTINKIIDETGVKIDITDEGKVMILTNDEDSARRAKEMILDICFVPTVGETYEGTVVNIMQFGAFVQIRHGVDGMIHISKLAEKRVEKVEDVVKLGDRVKVQVIKIDEKERIDLKLIEKIG